MRAAATRRGCSTGPRSGQRPHVGGQPTVAEQQPAAISWPELSRHATWDEVDTWTIPGERTKTGKPHRIPLSGRAQAVLDEARRLADDTGLIFGAPAPASRSATTPSARHHVPLTSRNRLRVPCQPQRLARSRRRILRTGRSRVGAPAKRDRQVVPARRPTRSAPPDHGTGHTTSESKSSGTLRLAALAPGSRNHSLLHCAMPLPKRSEYWVLRLR